MAQAQPAAAGQPGGGAAQPGAEGQAELPLRRVVMFNSGVGFYEHAGQVEGDAAVELQFNVDDINDLLKSMVLEDQGGGRISTVTYGSKDPITRTLQTFAIDLTANPTLAEILNQVRGEEVRIDAASPITGTIIGIEKRRRPVGPAGSEQIVEVDVLNLLTDGGLRSVPLDEVNRIELTDAGLNGELQQALATLAIAHATDKKTVALHFLGDGARPVRVGYIQESPIWKTSYRLVLDEEGSPFLQGWAIVENTTENDWQDVQLTLVSGRPISFVMDLYQPLYVPRPVVVPELFASLGPQVYGQDMERAQEEFARLAETQDLLARRDRAPAAPEAQPPAAGEGRSLAGAYYAHDDVQYDPGFALADAGVQSVAQTAEVGELFQYEIATPVTLPRQQSAMLPIVNQSVEGEKLSIYNGAVHAMHPLNGLRLHNTTGLHLMQGPITVFDGGAYAGDAQIEDLPPGSERLISYALDLEVEVAPEARTAPEQLVSCRLSRGVVYTSRKYARTQEYTIKNSGDEAKTVLIEYPLEANWTLVAPAEPTETTRDRYRFAVAAEPGEPAELVIEEEQTVRQEVALVNLDDGTIQYYLSARVVSDEVKEALREFVARKQELAVLAARRQQLEGQIAVIDQEQARIRQNMEQLDRNTELYNRYVQKFGEQEDMVEQLRAQIAELQQEETQKRQALDEYLLSLDVG
jgi:hypothetical protein